MLKPLAAIAAASLFAAGGVLTALDVTGDSPPPQVCATATASIPERILRLPGPTVDGAPLGEATYTLPGASAESTQCQDLPDPVTTTVTETVTAPTTTEQPPTTTEAPPTTTAPPPTTTAPPARVVYFGASTPPNSRHGTTSREAEAKWLEAKIGRKLDITRHYVKAPTAWTGDGASTTLANGRRVYVTFTSGGDTWPQVAGGSLDSYVCGQINSIKTGSPLWKQSYVAFENEPEADPGKGTAADYRRAYEHLMGLSCASGMVANWTTALMEFSWQSGSGRTPTAWIPRGLDALGVHGYSTRVSTCGDGARSFFDTFDGPHSTAASLGLRMVIGEAGYSTKVGTSPSLKANFFRSMPAALNKLPLVDAYTYWNQGSGKCAVANSYYLDSSPEALAGFADAGKSWPSP